MAGPGIKLETGHVIDERYLLENVIGEGGMGTVFAARHLELGDIVAIKVLQSDGALTTMPEENIERFLREARLAVKIKNEHVVRIIDVARGKNGAPPYIVMELLDGIDLGDLVHSLGQIRIPDAVDYLLQACEALAEAHALGIIHRDLKSSNLHVSKRADGSPLVKVLDFGISKAQDETGDMNLTSTSTVFGSPAYMSPEQIRSAKHVDHRTDVWALNVVLYELLTGHLPYVGDSAAAMLASISADPYTPMRKHLPDAPIELERAIHSAFVKDREKRTQSVAAFAESIAPFGGPTAAAAVVAIQRAAQRNPTRSIQPPPAIEPPSPVKHVSDTMRVAQTSVSDEVETEPIQPVPPAPPAPPASARAADEMIRTDREMVIPMTRPVSTPFLAIGGVLLALGIGIGVLALFLHVKSQPRQEAEFPPPPVLVTVSVTPPPAPPPPPSVAMPLPAVSLDLPAPTNSQRKPPRVAPHPPAAPAPPKPNHGPPDTSLRE